MKLKMMTNDRFDGYSLNIYQDEEGDYLAHFVELPGVSAFADTPEQALNELAIAWAGVKESYLKRGEEVPLAPSCKQYSGQFNVRIDKRLHQLLAVEAARAGVSLNSLVARKLAQSATYSA